MEYTPEQLMELVDAYHQWFEFDFDRAVLFDWCSLATHIPGTNTDKRNAVYAVIRASDVLTREDT